MRQWYLCDIAENTQSSQAGHHPESSPPMIFKLPKLGPSIYVDLLGRVWLLLLLVVRGSLGILGSRILSRGRLLLDLAELSLVVSGSSLRVGKTGPDEEQEVDDGQNPAGRC
jgi:hypothetical protein